ncbi:axonemal dynein light intermediate polypeptide 1 [Hetaerina americana]|uniref:axonemal dynein light intermediate polypeptide 1 n=1 Tax=Hetaerina americana TaxID=62018 RepID=UPI003A7F195D
MATKILQSLDSLVKYDTPQLITKRTEKKPMGLGKLPQGFAQAGASKDALKLPSPQAVDERKEAEEFLNTILPPREWEEDGHLWRQKVSSQPATRQDVITLQEELDDKLRQGQARETGICPIRREIYSQCFDELIRQVTINCSERGMLLLRVRDETRMTIAAYQALYESSIAFGMRKALQSTQGKGDIENELEEMKKERDLLEKQLSDLRAKAEQAERRATEQRLAEEKKNADEILFLKKTNQQLKAQLEGIIAPKK